MNLNECQIGQIKILSSQQLGDLNVPNPTRETTQTNTKIGNYNYFMICYNIHA